MNRQLRRVLYAAVVILAVTDGVLVVSDPHHHAHRKTSSVVVTADRAVVPPATTLAPSTTAKPAVNSTTTMVAAPTTMAAPLPATPTTAVPRPAVDMQHPVNPMAFAAAADTGEYWNDPDLQNCLAWQGVSFDAPVDPTSPVFEVRPIHNPFYDGKDGGPGAYFPPPDEARAVFHSPVVNSAKDLSPYPPVVKLIDCLVDRKFGGDPAQKAAARDLFEHEASFDPRAVQKDSAACGSTQVLPCSKLQFLDWPSQVWYGINHIQARRPNKFHDPVTALAYHVVHHEY